MQQRPSPCNDARPRRLGAGAKPEALQGDGEHPEEDGSLSPTEEASLESGGSSQAPTCGQAPGPEAAPAGEAGPALPGEPGPPPLPPWEEELPAEEQVRRSEHCCLGRAVECTRPGGPHHAAAEGDMQEFRTTPSRRPSTPTPPTNPLGIA